MYKLSQSNQTIQLGKELGRGGEAVVYEVLRHPNVVVKIYHPQKVPPLAKLQRMVAHPPHDPSLPQHVSIAWPQELVLNQQGQIVGYLMAKISNAMPLHLLSTPVSRKVHLPAFNWKYLHRTAHNLVAAVQAVHSAGYVIGDVNESNILVQPTALITLVDTDSFQVPNLHGPTFLCPVGKAEYVAPEIQGQVFSQIVRTELHDRFALTVLLFMLLQEGSHPFRGDSAELDKRIQQGLFFYHHNPLPLMKDLFEGLHPELQQLFGRCFVVGHAQPSQRPSAREWVEGLKKAEDGLVQCRANPEHWYYQQKSACTWCERTKALKGNDPFPRAPNSIFIQKPLPPVTLGGGAKISSFQVSPSVNIEMVLIPAGEFIMGSNEDNEKQTHKVKIEKAFYMGKYPVTQAQWKAVMGNNPSYFSGSPNLPVETVSWKDCIEFCKKLSAQTGKGFRLPNEAEWEYACRAGTTTAYWWGDSIDNNRCWYSDNSGGKTHPVDEKVNSHTNPFGLCDMSGNVWEWTHSDYTSRYNGSELVASRNFFKKKVLRGGSWYLKANYVRSADRYSYETTYRGSNYGFRIISPL